MERTKKITLRGLEDKKECPVLLGLAENDLFFKGEHEKVEEAFGRRATLLRLGNEDGRESIVIWER